MVSLWGNIGAGNLVPEAISRRQFYQVIAVREMITKAEALAAITTGTLPAALDAMVSLIADEDIEWQARMLLSGATEFRRSNGFVEFFGAMQGLDSGAMDQLWRDGHALD